MMGELPLNFALLHGALLTVHIYIQESYKVMVQPWNQCILDGLKCIQSTLDGNFLKIRDDRFWSFKEIYFFFEPNTLVNALQACTSFAIDTGLVSFHVTFDARVIGNKLFFPKFNEGNSSKYIFFETVTLVSLLWCKKKSLLAT